jgi:flagellar basal body-associated protein FliL
MAEEETREKEQEGEEGAAGGDKKRSKTELDLEDLGTEEVSQEDVGKDEAADKQEEKIQKRGVDKRELILTIFAVLLLLVMISGSVLIWARYFTSDDGKGLALSVPQGPVYELKPFFVSLNPDAKPKNFIRLTLVLELCDEYSYKQVTKRIEEVRSNIFKILLNTSPKNVENSKGQKELAGKIISIVNLLLAEKIVEKVFFKSVVVI